MERYGKPKWEAQRIRNIITTNAQGVFEMFWNNLPKYAAVILCESIYRLCAHKPSMRQQEKAYFKQCGPNAIERGENLWACPPSCPAQF